MSDGTTSPVSAAYLIRQEIALQTLVLQAATQQQTLDISQILNLTNTLLDNLLTQSVKTNTLITDSNDYLSSIRDFSEAIYTNLLQSIAPTVAIISSKLTDVNTKLDGVNNKLAGTLTIETSTFGSVSVSNSISTPALKVIGI